MVQYPICPKCTNTELSIIDIEIDGQKMKGVQCNSCNEFLWVVKDYSDIIQELKDDLESLESRVDDLR
jgi:hypothetical protein